MMFTIVFLVCMPNGQCMQQGPESVFPSEEACEYIAGAVMRNMQERVKEGVTPEHMATYKCVAWGTPS